MTCKVTEMRLWKLFSTHKRFLDPNTTNPKNLIYFKGLNNPQFITSLHSSSHRLYPQDSNFALNSSIPEIPTSHNSPDWESRAEKGSRPGFDGDTSRPAFSGSGNAVGSVNGGNDSEKSKDGVVVHNLWSSRYGAGELGDGKDSGGVRNSGRRRGYGEGFAAGGVGFKKKGKSKGCWVCSDCGHTEGQWWGACRVCKKVGTMKQFKVAENGTSGVGSGKVTGFEVSENSVRSWLPPSAGEVQPQRLRDINLGLNQLEWRIPLYGSFGEEVSRVLGGGLVPGSLVLVGGDPGVGKSTLILQIAAMIAEGHDIGKPAPVVYVSGEEDYNMDVFSKVCISYFFRKSVEQIGSRADRLNIVTEELYLYSSTDIEDILDKIQALSPRTLIVDSIQTVYLRGVTGSAGGLSQVKECTSALLRFAKKTNVPVILIGHVTKSGDIAGPRVLEHIVDVVLYLEGEKSSSHRLLRSVKNRFGSTDELGVFEMTQLGLEAVVNPSEIYLSQEEQSDSEVLAGLAIAAIMDSSRTFLLEIQALCVSGSTVSTSRHVNGIQASRADMIISVLVKQAGLKLQENAIFLNVVSGVSLTETAGDLAIAAAICSSFLEFPIPSGIAFIGEIGLAGELRTVPGVEKRVSTVAKLGYKTCIVPKSAEKALASLDFQEMAIISCKNLKEVINAVFTT